MTIKQIHEAIQTLASENMTEDGIHHDDFPDRQSEYIDQIIVDLKTINK